VDDDIVERLSDPGLCTCGFNEWECLPCAAKAEIERLRAERDAERALADQLADAIFSASVEEAIEKTDDALAAYDEARRG
jgi:hypothetical protein